MALGLLLVVGMQPQIVFFAGELAVFFFLRLLILIRDIFFRPFSLLDLLGFCLYDVGAMALFVCFDFIKSNGV